MIKEKLAKLINVKSIVTIALTLVICYLSIKQKIEIKDIYQIIIAFYFGTQLEKNRSE